MKGGQMFSDIGDKTTSEYEEEIEDLNKQFSRLEKVTGKALSYLETLKKKGIIKEGVLSN